MEGLENRKVDFPASGMLFIYFGQCIWVRDAKKVTIER